MILIMGIQGSGKGTQAGMLSEASGYTVLTLGDLIRAQVSEEQRQRIEAGQLLRDDEARGIIEHAIMDVPADAQYILDGFPRSIPQAAWLYEKAQTDTRFKIDRVIHLIATRDAVKARLLSRGRADDTEVGIEKRFDEYERATEPLFAWFKSHGIQVSDVDAERSVSEVNADLMKLINEK